MIVEKSGLTELLMHPSEQIRQAAIKGLRNFFRREEGVVKYILDSIEHFGVHETLSLASYLKCFLPASEDIVRITGLYTKSDPEVESRNKSLRFHLEAAFCEFPGGMLEKNKSAFAFNRDLRKAYEKALGCAEIRSWPPEQLWKKLAEHCEHSAGYAYTPSGIRFGKNLVSGLLQHKEAIAHRIIMNLSREKSWNDILEEYLVEIAGEMRLIQSAPHILKIFQRSSPERTIHGRCIKALGLIGGRELVSRLEWLYVKDEHYRYYISEIFSFIPEHYVVEAILRLMESEEDRGHIGLLIYSLCNIFSIDGVRKARSILQRRGEDRLAKELLPAMNAVFAYHRTEEIQEILPMDDISMPPAQDKPSRISN